jgi:SAM-dependent methyltransferase
MIERTKPADTLDIGTNGGEFANLAAAHGSRVVSIDTDVDALRVARLAAKQAHRNVLHMHVDFAAPTPALGWNGAECLSFDQRCHERFDLVLALAVMHHILVSGRIPMGEMLAKLAHYTRSWLLLEYIDPSDVMFATLARNRASDFSGLDSQAFERDLALHFDIEERVEVIPGRRTLYLCRRK